jgi:hypothetical protein
MNDNTMYGYTLREHEARFDIPRVYAGDGEARIVVAISAHGGGTLGKAYAANSWDYAVFMGTDRHLRKIISGQDISSAEGTPAGHLDMVRSLCSFLSAAGESLRWSGERSEYAGQYTGAAADFLVAEYERLGMVSAELNAGEYLENPVLLTDADLGLTGAR